MVVAAMFGLSFATISLASMGLFIEPLSHEFGWSRAEITAGLSLVALFAVPLSPPVGALIDRWGSRRLAIPGVILTACAFAAFSLANGSVRQWIFLWVCYGIVAVAIKTTVWTAAVSSVFKSSRGLALAVVLSGAAISQTLAPLTAQWLIDTYGWRPAYQWMGFGYGAFVLVLLLFFFFDARDHARREPPGTRAVASPILLGLTLREGLRDPILLRIAAALTICTFLGVAITVHKVPILGEIGISRQSAAQLAAAAGVAGLAGKLLTGWMMDRWRTSWISGISLSLPALACLVLLEPFRFEAAIVVAMVIFGYAAGATLQVCTLLTTRYGGLRHFGKIFGVMAGLMALASALGPVAAGAVFDRFGSYVPVLLAGMPIALCGGLLVSRLGPEPDWSGTRADDGQTSAQS
jgi:MFS family permease